MVKKINENYENVYHCDGCGIELPFDDFHWFSSSIGFCDNCDDQLHRKVPDLLFYELSEFCNYGDELGNQTAKFVMSLI